MLIMYRGTEEEAKARLRKKGWRDARMDVGPQGAIELMQKDSVIIAFDPDGGYASEPCAQTAFGFVPLPHGEPLREEAVDCLCDCVPAKG